MNGHLEAAMLLLKSGADIALRDSNGKTPVDLARQGGHAELAKALMEGPQSGGRQLIDGGLGVSGAMDIDL
jgi:ankyrin repeat protein